MRIVTGVRGKDHFTANDFRQMLAGILGVGDYILNVGEQFAETLVSNNQLDIGTGVMCIQGNLSAEDTGTSINIANGTQGMKRIDLVVNRYTRDASTGIESNEWVYIQGTPDESDPVRPEYTVGSILSGDLKADCPVFEIELDGINVVAVRPLLKTVISTTESSDLKSVLNNQIVSDNTAIIISTSSYFSLASKVFKYNKLTGAVHGEVTFTTTSSLSDGNTYKLCEIDAKYTPHNSVPVTIAIDLNDCIMTGRIKDNSESTNPSSIVVRTHMSIEKSNTVRVAFDYYIEPGLVD